MPSYYRPDHSRFELVQNSRELRQNATEAERFLWLRINRRQICGLNFRRQHPIGPYIVDFYCPELKFVIELDGGQHADPESKAYDEQRTRYLNGYGIEVLRFWNNEVFKNWEGIRRAIETRSERRSLPRPSSRKREEGDRPI